MLEGNYNGHAARPVTILSGIKQLAGTNIEVTFATGCPWALRVDGSNKARQEAIADAVAKAKAADVVIFVGGISARLEGEEMGRDNAFVGFEGGDRTTIELSPTNSGDDSDLYDTEKVVKESGDFGTQR